MTLHLLLSIIFISCALICVFSIVILALIIKTEIQLARNLLKNMKTYNSVKLKAKSLKKLNTYQVNYLFYRLNQMKGISSVHLTNNLFEHLSSKQKINLRSSILSILSRSATSFHLDEMAFNNLNNYSKFKIMGAVNRNKRITSIGLHFYRRQPSEWTEAINNCFFDSKYKYITSLNIKIHTNTKVTFELLYKMRKLFKKLPNLNTITIHNQSTPCNNDNNDNNDPQIAKSKLAKLFIVCPKLHTICIDSEKCILPKNNPQTAKPKQITNTGLLLSQLEPKKTITIKPAYLYYQKNHPYELEENGKKLTFVISKRP